MARKKRMQASPRRGQPQKPVKRKRGTLLSVLIGIIFLHAFLAALLAYASLQDQYAGSGEWVIPLLGVLALVDILAAIGMWNWKKWALYLYGISCIISSAVHLMLTGSLLVVFHDLLPLAILGYVINLHGRNKLFD